MRLQITKYFFLLSLLFLLPLLTSAQQIVTCQTCKGFGTVSVRKRIPVRKDVTYSFEGSLTKTYTNVVYSTRHVEETCYACNGRGRVVRQPMPQRRATTKPTPPPPPPPTLMENINKRFGYGSILANTTVGKDRLRVVTYRPKSNVSVNALLRVAGNQFTVVLDGYSSMYLLRDEYDRFDGLYLKDKATGKYAMADDNGRIIYQADHEFDKVNARGDIWQGTDRVRKIGGKTEREYELINYKTKERLSPGISLNDYCACKELWTEKGLIDVELPHAVLDDRTAIGLMNRAGEILIPPVYKEVLDCDVSRGMIRFLDDEGYVYDFDYLGRLLTPSEDVEVETCSDGSQIVRSKMLFLTTNSIRYKEADVELTDRVVIRHPDNSAIDGLIFREASCPDEDGWAEVIPTDSDIPLFLHRSGKLASTQEKTFSTAEIAKLPKVAFQPSSRVPEQWFVPAKEGSRVGGRLAYRDEEDQLVYRTIKPDYQQIQSLAPGQAIFQDVDGLWGVWVGAKTVKPKYQELYQIHQWKYLGVSNGKMFVIDTYGDKKIKIEKVKKLPFLAQLHYEKVLKYNRWVPHQLEDLSNRLESYGLSPDEPITGRKIVLDQKNSKPHQAYWFTQNERHHLVVFINNIYKGDDYFHYKLPDGVTHVADAVYIYDHKYHRKTDGKGYMYIPYRIGEEPYRLLQFNREKFDPVEDPAMRFDEVYAVPIPTDQGPHSLVFENESGYFTLYRGYQGGKKSISNPKKLGLKLIGVK